MSEDIGFNEPQFRNMCTNAIKAAKGANDTVIIKANIEKLFAECQRLAKLAEN